MDQVFLNPIIVAIDKNSEIERRTKPWRTLAKRPFKKRSRKQSYRRTDFTQNFQFGHFVNKFRRKYPTRNSRSGAHQKEQQITDVKTMSSQTLVGKW